MKNNLFIFLLILSTISIKASDWNKFGILGECNTANSQFETLKFDKAGNLSSFIFKFSDSKIESVGSVQQTKDGYKGLCKILDDGENYTGSYQITMGAQGITKFYLKYDDSDDGTLTSTYTYDSNKVLIKRVDDEVWWEVDSYSLETDAAARARKADAVIEAATRACARNPLDFNGNVRRMEAARNKAAAILAGTDASIKTKKTKKTSKATVLFSDYQKDRFNNWISRKVIVNNNTYNERRDIDYTDEFLSRYEWERLKQSDNMRAIEMFAMNKKTTKQYKQIASEYWNSNILPKIAKDNNNNPDSLFYAAFSPIASKEISNKALDTARRNFYDNQVMKERDFNKVRDMASMKVRDQDVFDFNYKNMIESRAEQLRNDSINYLVNEAQNYFSSGQMNLASQLAKDALAIDEFNHQAQDIAAHADFNIIEAKEKNGTITDDDYIEFCNFHKSSTYSTAVADKLVDHAINKKGDYKNRKVFESFPGYLSEFQKMSLPISNKANSKLSNAIDKSNMELAGGRLIHFGIGLALGGSTASEFRFETALSLLFGRFSSPINAQISFGYGYVDGPSGDNKANITVNNLIFPLMLRWNFYRKYRPDILGGKGSVNTFYLAAGAQLSLLCNAHLNFSSQDKDYTSLSKDFFSKTMLSPKIAIGAHFSKIYEIEVFGIINSGSLYKIDYLRQIGADEILGQNAFNSLSKKNTIQIGGVFRLVF